MACRNKSFHPVPVLLKRKIHAVKRTFGTAVHKVKLCPVDIKIFCRSFGKFFVVVQKFKRRRRAVFLSFRVKGGVLLVKPCELSQKQMSTAGNPELYKSCVSNHIRSASERAYFGSCKRAVRFVSSKKVIFFKKNFVTCCRIRRIQRAEKLCAGTEIS